MEASETNSLFCKANAINYKDQFLIYSTIPISVACMYVIVFLLWTVAVEMSPHLLYDRFCCLLKDPNTTTGNTIRCMHLSLWSMFLCMLNYFPFQHTVRDLSWFTVCLIAKPCPPAKTFTPSLPHTVSRPPLRFAANLNNATAIERETKESQRNMSICGFLFVVGKCIPPLDSLVVALLM